METNVLALVLGVLAVLGVVAMSIVAIYCGRRVRISAHNTDIEVGSPPQDDDPAIHNPTLNRNRNRIRKA